MQIPTDRPLRVAAFAERLLDTLNHAALALQLSAGHRTGLFDAMAGQPAASSATIARRAGLDERYVRESLAALAVSGVVDAGADGTSFFLPDEHAACLTRAAGARNLAAQFQWIAVLGEREDRVVECFARGGGIAADARAQALDAESSIAPAIDEVLKLVPALADALRAGIDVLIAGPRGSRAARWLMERFPAARVAEGSAEDAAGPDAGAFDLVALLAGVHDLARPDRAFASAAAVLRPGGVFLLRAFRAGSCVQGNLDHALGPFLYTLSTFHSVPASLAAGGYGHGACWGRERVLASLRAAGFRRVEVRQLAMDFENDWFVARA